LPNILPRGAPKPKNLLFRDSNPLAELTPVVGADEITGLQRSVRPVFVHPAVETYMLRLVRATRTVEAI